jgi:hypothetical protein
MTAQNIGSDALARSGSDARQYVSVGDTVTVELPYSEVCMHMRVAGRRMPVRLQDARYFNGEPAPGSPVAQILTESGGEFSFPVLYGEAGFYRDETGRFYTYVPDHAREARPARHLRVVA